MNVVRLQQKFHDVIVMMTGAELVVDVAVVVMRVDILVFVLFEKSIKRQRV